MEDLKQVVNRLQEKFNELVVSEDAIRSVINSHSKNMENLNKKIDYVEDRLVKGIDRTTTKISEDIYKQEE